jgi:hypothetical protein
MQYPFCIVRLDSRRRIKNVTLDDRPAANKIAMAGCEIVERHEHESCGDKRFAGMTADIICAPTNKHRGVFHSGFRRIGSASMRRVATFRRGTTNE